MSFLPPWTSSGVLPPFVGEPVGAARSPYEVPLHVLVDRFATTPARCAILDGLLSFRAALHRLGFVRGFQWIDGSFTEDAERLVGRAPRDVDVVSFVHDPRAETTPQEGDEAALDPDATKARFSVDSYFVELDVLSAPELVQQAGYWYGVWSHRRDESWKGFVQVTLAPDDGSAASALRIRQAGGAS